MHQESNVTATSRSSFYDNVISGKARSDRERIFLCVADHQVPINRRQISELTGLPINIVTGRAYELLENYRKENEYKYGDLVVAYIAEDPVTKARRVEYLDLAPVNKPIKQINMFS